MGKTGVVTAELMVTDAVEVRAHMGKHINGELTHQRAHLLEECLSDGREYLVKVLPLKEQHSLEQRTTTIQTRVLVVVRNWKEAEPGELTLGEPHWLENAVLDDEVVEGKPLPLVYTVRAPRSGGAIEYISFRAEGNYWRRI